VTDELEIEHDEHPSVRSTAQGRSEGSAAMRDLRLQGSAGRRRLGSRAIWAPPGGDERRGGD